MISTHVLDTTTGRPAAGVQVILEEIDPFTVIGSAITDEDGRAGELGPAIGRPGNYRLIFETSLYYAKAGQTCFYPQVIVSFSVTDASKHLHIPLLISPFAYSTYKGS
ncbi:5-hydroxyisourate hydrolase [Kribbella sp. VKM Ac-2527]|uniref:5-hydroxyisourate hydrolase n=1 Tax=Kribbella caucasensis TaxID=2512215 RepID=A0A4R6JKZ0_9ACTN|nr:hydroxyisourate hydrolase [Kribbella sp. VKM Ac-2527]TDO35215.1 5-hydroxyisourate hydrolase [Kribbella sp. VKM Ac-2527]